MGYTALLIFAGLQTIPKYVYEAASVDGGTEWQSFWRITLPLLRPILALVLVITVTGSFQIFDTVAVTTKGGPVNATRVIQFYIYQKALHAERVRLRQRDLGDPVHHPRDRRPRSAEGAERRRVGSGLRGETAMTTTTAPSRAATMHGRRTGEAHEDAVQQGPDRGLGRDDHHHSDHAVPVLLDAAHRALHREVAVRRPGLAAAGRLHPRGVQAGARPGDSGRGPGRGRLRRRGQLLALPAQLVHRRRLCHRRPGVLQRAGGVRLRPAAVAGPGQGVLRCSWPR